MENKLIGKVLPFTIKNPTDKAMFVNLCDNNSIEVVYEIPNINHSEFCKIKNHYRIPIKSISYKCDNLKQLHSIVSIETKDIFGYETRKRVFPINHCNINYEIDKWLYMPIDSRIDCCSEVNILVLPKTELQIQLHTEHQKLIDHHYTFVLKTNMKQKITLFNKNKLNWIDTVDVSLKNTGFTKDQIKQGLKDRWGKAEDVNRIRIFCNDKNIMPDYIAQFKKMKVENNKKIGLIDCEIKKSDFNFDLLPDKEICLSVQKV